jgi:hypothetical protein
VITEKIKIPEVHYSSKEIFMRKQQLEISITEDNHVQIGSGAQTEPYPVRTRSSLPITSTWREDPE